MYREGRPERRRRPVRAILPSAQRTADGAQMGPIFRRRLLAVARVRPKNGECSASSGDHHDASGYPRTPEADQRVSAGCSFTGCDAERMKKLFRDLRLHGGKYADKGTTPKAT